MDNGMHATQRGLIHQACGDLIPANGGVPKRTLDRLCVDGSFILPTRVAPLGSNLIEAKELALLAATSMDSFQSGDEYLQIHHLLHQAENAIFEGNLDAARKDIDRAMKLDPLHNRGER